MNLDRIHLSFNLSHARRSLLCIPAFLLLNPSLMTISLMRDQLSMRSICRISLIFDPMLAHHHSQSSFPIPASVDLGCTYTYYARACIAIVGCERGWNILFYSGCLVVSVHGVRSSALDLMP